MAQLLKRFRYHIAIFFAVFGPGFITAVVDNDAGGIVTYSTAGAQFGYLPLWTLLPITFMTMALPVLLNMTNIMSEFAGIADSLGLFHISKYISVPVFALVVWLIA